MLFKVSLLLAVCAATVYAQGDSSQAGLCVLQNPFFKSVKFCQNDAPAACANVEDVAAASASCSVQLSSAGYSKTQTCWPYTMSILETSPTVSLVKTVRARTTITRHGILTTETNLTPSITITTTSTKTITSTIHETSSSTSTSISSTIRTWKVTSTSTLDNTVTETITRRTTSWVNPAPPPPNKRFVGRSSDHNARDLNSGLQKRGMGANGQNIEDICSCFMVKRMNTLTVSMPGMTMPFTSWTSTSTITTTLYEGMYDATATLTITRATKTSLVRETQTVTVYVTISHSYLTRTTTTTSTTTSTTKTVTKTPSTTTTTTDYVTYTR